MALTLWSTFYDDILPYLNGVTTAVVDARLRKVAIEFCKETLLHSEELALINVVAGTAAYTLTPVTSETDVVQVKAAWVSGAPLDYAPLDVLNTVPGYWGTATSSTPTAYTQRTPTQVILYPAPSENITNGLRVEVTLKPTLTATGLTDWIATKYRYVIADGVIGQLMAQPAVPWNNPQGATYYLTKFEMGKSEAITDTYRSQTRATLQVRMRSL